MKQIFSILTVLLISVRVIAQSPEKMSYQAVIRGNGDALVTNHAIGMQITILQGSINGAIVYTEVQTPITNANGLVSVEIGGGPGFSSINWANGPYFIKTETDPGGGTNYNITSISQLLSVPYALNAKKAETADYNNLTNQPILNISNWNTAYGWGNHSTAGYISSGNEGDGTIGNEVADVTNTTLTRGGTGTSASPFTIGLNLGNNNTWTASQSFNSNTYFPGSGVWNTNGNVGIGTTNPANKLQVQNGNLVIDRPQSTSTLSLGSVAGTIARVFAGDAGAGSLNTNYNQIKLTANPANTEEMLRLHTGADAMSNSGTAAIYFGQFNLQDMAAVKAINEGGQPMGRTAGLSFWTEPAGTGVPLQERMRISGNGNVGIGTTVPGSTLDVNGVISATGGSSTLWNTAYSWGNHAGLYRPAGYIPSWNEVTDKPSFALVATSGNYDDLLNRPPVDGSETKVTAGTKVTVTGSGTASAPYVINMVDAGNSHHIGEAYGGGIVFYIYDNGQHGLIAATENQSTGIQWSNAYTRTNALRDGIRAGVNNTERIIINQGTGNYAAQLCSTYKGGDYGDWYLPSKFELNLLYLQKDVVGGFPAGYDYSYYWSSTEDDTGGDISYAWYQIFYDGRQLGKGGSFKLSAFNVRAVRAF